MPKPLKPKHFWACMVDGREVESDSTPDPCPDHNVAWYDMGWRVGEAAANYSWYSTYDRAMTDRRTK